MVGESSTRQPPNDLVAEASVLGAMLLNKMAISDVVEILEAEHFYRPAYGHIYSAITTLYATGEPVDPVTVSSELTAAGLLDAIGGPSVLFSLQTDVPAVGNAAAYARIVEEKALLRRAIEVSNQIAEMAYGVPDDVAKMIDEAEALMYEVGQRRITGTTVEIKDLLSENLDRLEALYEQGDAITGMPTGFIDLDKLMAGLQKNALYVVGARPGMGKTAFLLGVAANAAKAGHPVLLFSLEMSSLELSQRILCSEAKVDSTRIKTGNLHEDDWTRIAHATGTLADTPIYIDDHPQTSIMEIRAKARRLRSNIGELGLVAVDYVQLMSGRANSESRQQEVSEISRNLKILARELECPVVALAQLNRKLEERADKRPMLSDLRESGSLEQDADAVFFLYRDEQYNSDSPDAGMAEVIVAKHRSGPTGTVKLAFLGRFTRFENMAHRPEPVGVPTGIDEF
ncbi:MAG: replicative DNA helicase [Acidimicrobiales bacterium]|nr:replicative DNA helicase [Acidimicrobiales bacterium]